ncbi:MAG: hypothetical protein OXB97_04490 [Rhodospirillales bacterium]|nr:hypothetical protein [Rhodospirillales bacterium]
MSASREHDRFARRLRAAIAARGWTRQEFCRRYHDAAQLNRASGSSSIDHYFKARSMPRARTLRLFCDVLDVSADWLLGRTAACEPLGLRASRLDEADRLAVVSYVEMLVERAERRRAAERSDSASLRIESLTERNNPEKRP